MVIALHNYFIIFIVLYVIVRSLAKLLTYHFHKNNSNYLLNKIGYHYPTATHFTIYGIKFSRSIRKRTHKMVRYHYTRNSMFSFCYLQNLRHISQSLVYHNGLIWLLYVSWIYFICDLHLILSSIFRRCTCCLSLEYYKWKFLNMFIFSLCNNLEYRYYKLKFVLCRHFSSLSLEYL